MAQAVSFLNSVTCIIKKIVMFMEARAKRAQCYRELSALTARELNDIGINRGDIRAVVNDKFYADSIRTNPSTEVCV